MGKFSFPRQRRLLTAGDFRCVFEKAEFKISDKHLLLLARSNQSSQSRLGFIIAKKHVKRAIDRNRIKRTIREAFRTDFDATLLADPTHEDSTSLVPLDIVILARAGIGDLQQPYLDKLLTRQWQRLAKKMALAANAMPVKSGK